LSKRIAVPIILYYSL